MIRLGQCLGPLTMGVLQRSIIKPNVPLQKLPLDPNIGVKVFSTSPRVLCRFTMPATYDFIIVGGTLAVFELLK